VAKRDFEAFVATTGSEAVAESIQKDLRTLIEDPTYAPLPKQPISEIAQTAGGESRWTINLAPTSDPVLPERSIITDLKKTEDKSGYLISKISLPSEENGDPLSVALSFSQAVVSKNFELARQLTNSDKLTDERVAALMMALEEGRFSLREQKPLVVTLSQDNLKWVLARIDSESTKSEFTLEMSADDEGLWKIHQLTFSKLIASLASQSGAGGVAYAPLIDNPTGGDSIVLYFEFDEKTVTARTERQLEIIAGILKDNPARNININGHADALGSAGYNFALSKKRATSVKETLIKYGVPESQVTIEAFGKTAPILPNYNPDGTDNPSNRSQNRRAEVYLDF